MSRKAGTGHRLAEGRGRRNRRHLAAAHQICAAAYYIIAPAEASSNLARYDGVRYGLRDLPDGAGLQDMYAATRAAGFGPEVKRRILIGTYVLSAGFYDAYYTQAQKVRTLISRDFKERLHEVDVILAPTAPTAAFALGEKSADPLAMYLNDVFAVPPASPGCPRCRCLPGSTAKACRWACRSSAPVRRTGRAERRAGDRAARGFGQAGEVVYRIQGATGEWEVVIGLEVHAQVTSKSKLFSGAATAFGAEPNAQVSLVDAAMPGMLPVPNRECIRQAVRTGMAIDARRSTNGRGSTARTTSTPICRRATRSASSTTRSWARHDRDPA
jgi:hypothetical protein